jgi:hypothetical protein
VEHIKVDTLWLALALNINISWSGVPGTNTLAYNAHL